MLAVAGRCIGLAALALAALTADSAPGEAEPRASGAASYGTQRPGAGDKAGGPLLAVVSIARQRVQIYDGPRVVAQSPVSTGMAGFRTPTGVFSILQKRRYHESNIYSGAPMPFMQRLTWSGVALHAGVLPGYPASHGCIRLPHGFATELWGMTRLGTRVVVAPDDPAAVVIEDERLPAPRLTPVPLDDDHLYEDTASTPAGATLASAAGRRMADADGALGVAGVPRLTPWQRVHAARALAGRTAAATVAAARSAASAAAARAAAARGALAALRRAEQALAAAQRRRDLAARAAASVSRPAAVERAAEVLAAAQDALGEAERAADSARLTAAILSQEAQEAAAAAADAEAARREAATAVKAAESTVEPISILVSRKTGRVYIRQAGQPVHEAPVAFKGREVPLGTHVYLATGAAAEGTALRWISVSLPASAARAQRPADRGALPVAASAAGPGAASSGQETAAGALARFDLPEETRRFIADRLWAGATLIVSDQGVSGETGPGTDLIVLTR